MIAKIMKSASSFQAVYYNEHKVSEQKAELMKAANFPMGSELWDKNQYIAYLTKVATLNPNVRLKQFHVVLSTKGQEHDKEELKRIGEAYLKRMGYGENPYLMYFHQDTANNHIHIVSTRVNTEGVKIDHNFEKRRSLQNIESIMKQIPELKQTGDTLKKELLAYRFSTESQLKLLAKQRGYSTKSDDKEGIDILKEKTLIASISKEEIQGHIAKNPQSEERKKQIKALLLKYSQSNNEAEMSQYLREKIGIELVFHKGQGKETPYGYTIIDHKTKAVFKGSEVLKVNTLLSRLNSNIKNNNENEHKKQIREIVEPLKKAHKTEKETIKEALNDYLDEHDLYIMEQKGKLHLVDAFNDEVHDLSNITVLVAHKDDFDFINLDKSRAFTLDSYDELEEDKKEGITLDLFVATPDSDESESDRKRKYKR
jgi:uncharacterized pyridoxamine 5'-phosphate oxidase family protein